MTSDWIEHDGKGPPDLPPGTLVVTMFRDDVAGSPFPDPWEYWCSDDDDPRDYWTFSEDEPYFDIVAYRIAT